jgi:hypothetical protein
MARRKKNGIEAALTGLATVIGGLFVIAKKLAIGLDLFGQKQRKQQLELANLQSKLTYLRNKYTDEALVQRMMRGQIWPGQTAEQLNDSLGLPIAVDDIQLKTRKREVWKYGNTGINRYRLRITLDNDVVVSWDQKN